ncbi:serine/threonine-protein kinase [Streptomyces sp. CB02923]|uniref:serine/threonine-protein kinase n=1 Tax=Streptomyces sp. CB02923 TaxID=1718985 RepID=UPI001F5BAC15
MGVVWRARDEVLAREVAVKEVRAPRDLTTREEELLYTRLEREGRAAARIAHRNVVTVFDVVSEGGRPWIVMELVRGLSLAETLAAEGPMEPRRAAGIGAQVLAALRVAHTAGVLHRDVKPGNVLLSNDGRVVLTDFGIARVAGSAALTLTGELVGSPEFLAPERALGQQAGPESDLWSLGVTLYAAVEGSSPFRQDTPLTTLRAVVDEPLPPPRRAGPLAPVLEGLLRKDPRERLDAAEAQGMLEAVAGGGATPTVVVPPPTVSADRTYTADGYGYGPAAPMPEPGPPNGTPDGTPAGDTTTAVAGREAERRRRRSVRLLLAGALLALLAAGGVAYALLNDGGTPDRTPGSTTGGGGSGGSTGDGGGGTGGGGGASPGQSSPGSTASATTPPGATTPGRTYPATTPPGHTYPRTTPPRTTPAPTTGHPTTTGPTTPAPTTSPATTAGGAGDGGQYGGATGTRDDGGGARTYEEVPPGGGTS